VDWPGETSGASIGRDTAAARVDVRQLETGKPVGILVQVRIVGERIDTLRNGEQVAAILRAVPEADRVRDEWGADSFTVRLTVGHVDLPGARQPRKRGLVLEPPDLNALRAAAYAERAGAGRRRGGGRLTSMKTAP
jgi:hypothetical protein